MNKRIIMIEGCDRTGKSTFISLLENKLKSEGKIPIIFHLMGPTKFKSLEFNNDDKSLIQLAKFNDEYNLIREMLKANENIVIILDRTSFGEYVWSSYWNREGKYTEYTWSKEFIEPHKDLFDQTLYIYYYISQLHILEQRISESPEDVQIFTQYNMPIKTNIMGVYSLYEDLNSIIRKNNIAYQEYDNIGTLIDVQEYVDKVYNEIK
jgi:thymidylate kinase